MHYLFSLHPFFPIPHSTHTFPFSLFVPHDFEFHGTKETKRGLTRMDAVLDQLSCFGFSFSRRLIRQTVRTLLKLYGEDGWKLIEEDGYKVVLDVILDEQESAQKANILTGTKNDECCKDITMDKTAHSSTFHDDHSTDIINNSKNAPVNYVPTYRRKPCYGWISDDDEDIIDNSKNAPVNYVPTYRRKPCYGWISDDDDDGTYFISLISTR
ncbi:hypothetical protein L1887_16097 [Cichorium endivia]|nr:hypothetical protein L1887_16097 [Cichorium endivia]